jgi:hypothetical protein
VPTGNLRLKHDVSNSHNTTNYSFATAGVQDSNNYMFRPFLLAIIRLYIPSFKSMYNKLIMFDDEMSIILMHSIQYCYYDGLQYI